MTQDFLNTGTQGGNFDGLVDFLTKLRYDQTTCLSLAGRTEAIATLHKWAESDINPAADTSVSEGSDPTFDATDIKVSTTLSNECSLLRRNFKVSGTQNAVKKAGLGKSSSFEEEKIKKYSEIALDLDLAILTSTGQTRVADSGTKGKMTGLVNVSEIYNIDAGGNIVTHDLVTQLMQQFTAGGENATDIFANGFVKNAISNFALNNRTYNDANKTFTNEVLFLDTGWGRQRIVYNKHLTPTTLLALNMNHIKVAYLRPVGYEMLGKTGDNDKGFVFSEATVQYGSRKAIGTITNCGLVS